MRILGIESSCDETGVALYDKQHGIIADVLHSQLDIHAQYGGVVPELASRDHIRMVLPLVRRALEQTKTTADMLSGIAYTAGPGLIGALLVGVAIGRGLSLAWGLPAIPVHHMEAHLLAPMLEKRKPEYPFLALLISGGHTLLVAVEEYRRYTVLGESVDDAAGEAFDKVAKLLGLPYPGGAPLAALAEKGNPDRFHFPRPMTSNYGLNFSFSGLKTHVFNTINKADGQEQTRADIARAFVDAVVDTLTIKCRWAIRQSGLKRIVVAGGVSANRQLRARLQQTAEEDGLAVYFPRPQFCTDNGAMIAYAGYLQLIAGDTAECTLKARPRWPLSELQPK